MRNFITKLLIIAAVAGFQNRAYPSAVIFSGSDVKTLKSNIDLNGNSKVMSGTVDPTSSATSAPIGSLYLNTTTGNHYRKLDSGSSTNWALVGAGGVANNQLANPDWNSVSTGWTASGGTYARTTTSGQKAFGAGGGSWDSSSASQTLTSGSVTITAGEGFVSANIAGYCKFKAASGTATHKIQIHDGTNVLAEQSITSSTSQFITSGVTVGAATSGTFALRIISVASDEPTLYVDDCYLGLAEGTTIQNVSQAQFFGSIVYAGQASCQWTRTSSATWADYSADTDCAAPTVAGNASAPATKVPSIVIPSLPPGHYVFEVGGVMNAQSASSACSWRITDGTNSTSPVGNYSGTAPGHTPVISGALTYTSAQSNVTFTVQGTGSTSSVACSIDADQTTRSFSVRIYRFPATAEMAYRPDQTPASWSGYHDTTCSWARTNTAFGDPTADASCALSTSGRAAATNLSCTTTGSVLPGLSCTLPKIGKYRVCASFAPYGSSGSEAYTVQLVDGSGNALDMAPFNHTATLRMPMRLCGLSSVSSVGSASIWKLQSRASGTASITIEPYFGSNAVEWTVEQADAQAAAPLLVGSVTSNSSGLEKVERAYITGGVSPAVTYKSSDWITFSSRGATGTYTFAISGFSGIPSCTCSAVFGAANTCSFQTVSQTAISTNTYRMSTAADTDMNLNIICMGPR
jgi:hypothetical protein